MNVSIHVQLPAVKKITIYTLQQMDRSKPGSTTLAFHWFFLGAPYRIAHASSSNWGSREAPSTGCIHFPSQEEVC